MLQNIIMNFNKNIIKKCYSLKDIFFNNFICEYINKKIVDIILNKGNFNVFIKVTFIPDTTKSLIKI